MKKIIIFSRYFSPAIKAGGPIRSIENILKIFGKKYKFLLVTGDRDLDGKIFKNIKFNEIKNKKNFKIIYQKKDKQNFKEFLKIIKNFQPDVIYLNSFFDFKFSILVSVLNKFIFDQKLIISPRGELFSAAIQNKYLKKKIYILISKIFNIYSKVIFHLNSIKEKEHTTKEIGKKINYKILPVFYSTQKKISLNLLNIKRDKFIILFASRIIKNKNLDFCLKILNGINFDCEFNIIGQIEDKSYWNNCIGLIKNIRKNIKINYLGIKNRKEVNILMRKSHCLLHPSKFESFGHVIFEAFLNGLPVIISNNTPWKNLKKKGIGINLSLNKVHEFRNEINYLKLCNDKIFTNYRKKALKYANQKILEEKKFFTKDIF